VRDAGNDFKNRSNELGLLRADLTRDRTEPRAVVISGASGLGKSRLTHEVGTTIAEQRSYLRVGLSATANLRENGFLIREIAGALNAYALEWPDSSIASLSEFVRSGASSMWNTRWRRKVAQSMAAGVSQKVLAAWQGLDAVTLRGEFRPSTLLGAREGEDTHILTEYVLKQLLRTPSLLVIENIQRCDEASLNFLDLVMNGFGPLYILAEFTTGSDAAVSLEELTMALGGPDRDVQSVELEPLSYEHFRDILGKDAGLLEGYLRRCYDTSGGDLRQLVDIRVATRHFTDWKRLIAGSDPGDTTPAQINIGRLNDHEFGVLVATHVHRSQLAEDTLRLALMESEGAAHLADDLSAVIESLVDRQLIKRSKGGWSLGHDRLIAAIESDTRWETHATVWRTVFGDHYARLIANDDFSIVAERDAVAYVFEFLAPVAPKRLLGHIDRLRRLMSTAFTPTTGPAYLRPIVEALRLTRVSGHIERIAWSVVDMCFEIGLMNEARAVLSLLPARTDRWIAYHVALLNREDRHQEAVETIEVTCASGEAPAGESFWATLRLIGMISLRSMNRDRETREWFAELAATPQLNMLPEYPILLRNAEIVLRVSESIEPLHEALQYYEKARDHKNEMQVLVGLGMQYARLGLLDEAENALRKAEERTTEITFEHHILVNNMAVLALYQQRAPQEASELLRRGLLTATSDFDRLALNTNLLIASTLIRDRRAAGSCRARLEELLERGHERDAVLRRVVLFNMYWAAEELGWAETRRQYLSEARGSFEQHDEYWSFRLSGGVCQDEEYAFRRRFPFHCCFTSFWHFQIGTHLAH